MYDRVYYERLNRKTWEEIAQEINFEGQIKVTAASLRQQMTKERPHDYNSFRDENDGHTIAAEENPNKLQYLQFQAVNQRVNQAVNQAVRQSTRQPTKQNLREITNI